MLYYHNNYLYVQRFIDMICFVHNNLFAHSYLISNIVTFGIWPIDVTQSGSE